MEQRDDQTRPCKSTSHHIPKRKTSDTQVLMGRSRYLWLSRLSMCGEEYNNNKSLHEFVPAKTSQLNTAKNIVEVVFVWFNGGAEKVDERWIASERVLGIIIIINNTSIFSNDALYWSALLVWQFFPMSGSASLLYCNLYCSSSTWASWPQRVY